MSPLTYLNTRCCHGTEFTLTSIAFERYRAVLHPYKVAGATKQCAKVAILCIWLLGALFALPYGLALRVVYDPRTGTRDRRDDYAKEGCYCAQEQEEGTVCERLNIYNDHNRHREVQGCPAPPQRCRRHEAVCQSSHPVCLAPRGPIALPRALALRVVYDPRTGARDKPMCTNGAVPPAFWQEYMYALGGIQYVLPLVLMSYACGRMAAWLRGSSVTVTTMSRREVTAHRNKKND